MKKRERILSLMFIAVVIAIFSFLFVSVLRQREVHPIVEQITLEPGFKMDVFAEDLGGFLNVPGPNSGPRMMGFYRDVLFVSVPKAGKIIALKDNDKDGKADSAITVIEGLNNPHGFDFLGSTMYIANEDSIARVKLKEDLEADMQRLEYLRGLPKGGHFTRTLKIINNEIYVSIGSSCNACVENDESRGTVLKCDFEGNCRIFASGLRNAVGFVANPETRDIYATENSRDWLGDNVPPDEINVVKDGKHYGWPYCFGKNTEDMEFANGNCNLREPSFVDLQAHSAPLGLAFNYGRNFPSEYIGDLFVAYHGSWNRKEKTGYKIVRIDTKTKEVSDFATGWLTANGNVLGRPVDIVFDKDGIMYISDDNSGLIYKVWHGFDVPRIR